MIFETKKIQLETLSEYLIEVRTEFDMTLAEVAEKTSIKPVFLEYLEQGEFQKLPADVYVFGFLRQLAVLYSIDPTMLIEQYKKERTIVQQLQKKPMFTASSGRKLLNKIVITPKYLSLTLGLLFVVVTLGYVVWQVSSINKTPTLEIASPQDRQIVKDTIVTAQGKTDPGMSLTINDQNVFVDSQGNFKTQIGVDNGPKHLIFIARNKFEKTTTKTLTVIGETAGSPVASTSQTGAVQLRLEFTGDSSLTYSIDGASEQSLAFSAGDAKVLSGQGKIVISVSDAGSVKVTYNGDNLGFIGKSGEKLQNIQFKAVPVETTTSTPQ